MVGDGGKTGNCKWQVEVPEQYITMRTRTMRKCPPIRALLAALCYAANFFPASLRHPDSAPAELHNLHGLAPCIGKDSASVMYVSMTARGHMDDKREYLPLDKSGFGSAGHSQARTPS